MSRGVARSLWPLFALVLFVQPLPHAAAETVAAAPPPSPDETVARSYGELAALVANPSGPHDIFLPAGTYTGDIVVKRPLSLRGAPGAILRGSGTDTVLTIHANDVSVASLRIEHSGRRNTTEDSAIKATGERVRLSDIATGDTLGGISLQECHHCSVERARVQGDVDDDPTNHADGIKLWESHDSIVRGCTVDRMRDVVIWYTRRAVLEDNVFTNGRYGTHFMYAHDSIARGNRMEHNTVGIFVMYSARITVERNVLAGAHGPAGMGLGFKESDALEVRNNWIVANTTGTYLDDSPRTPDKPVFFERNVVALNDTALRLHGIDSGVTVRGNAFRNNNATIELDGGKDARKCDVHGNYYSDYEGYDLNSDGVGDVPYMVSALSSDLEANHPSLRLMEGTVAMGILDGMAHAFPVLEARTLLEDPAPLVLSPELPTP